MQRSENANNFVLLMALYSWKESIMLYRAKKTGMWKLIILIVFI